MTKQGKVNLLFVGDFCTSNPKELSIGPKFRALLDSSDVKYLNFEGPLPVGEKKTAGDFFLHQSLLSPDWCVSQGFNVIGLANNHAYDFGSTGLYETYKAFSPVTTIGCGKWNDAYSVKFITVNSVKIGLFSATSGDLASLKLSSEDSEKYACPWINHISVPGLISSAKQECDILFVIPHAGVEYMDVPLPEWREIYKYLIDSGADGIIASHPHVPQGWELYKGRPIFYSLGNFIFNTADEPTIPFWYTGIAAVIKYEDGKFEVSSEITKFENNQIEISDDSNLLNYYKSICDLLQDENEYNRHVNEYVSANYEKYEEWLLNGLVAIKLKPFNCKKIYHIIKEILHCQSNYRVSLHQLREESTRWTLSRAYKLKSNTNL